MSRTKPTHGSKILPKVQKQIKNVTIYSHRIPQSWFFMHLIFVLYSRELAKLHTLRKIYIWIRKFLYLDQSFSFSVTERKFDFSYTNATYLRLCYYYTKAYTEGLQYFANLLRRSWGIGWKSFRFSKVALYKL